MPDIPPVLVIGISGATWDLVDPLARASRLPALAALCARGARAVLWSPPNEGDRFPRPQSAWATIATGVGPQRHGITRFYHEGADLERPPLWARFSSAGERVGVFGWPGSWPPPQVDGFVVPSHFARDDRTWPPELAWIKQLDRGHQTAERDAGSRSELARSVGVLGRFASLAADPLPTATRLLPLAVRAALAGDEERALTLRFAKLELSASLFAGLYRRHRPHFASFHSFLVDFASHRYWRYMAADPLAGHGGKLAGAVPEAYARTDAAVGRLLRELPPDGTVFVLSEHGMAAEQDATEVGRSRYLLRAEAIRRFAGLDDVVAGVPIARWVAFRAEGAELPADSAARLRSLTIVETGLPLLEVHVNGEQEVVIRLSIHRDVPRYQAGDLEALTVSNGRHTRPFVELVRPLGATRSAMHTEEGVFLCAGPGVRRGVDLGRIGLVDVAPTILHVAGLRLPDDLSGRVLTDAFES